jgi:ABC-2 type transport system ATP-binding protein
LEYLDFCAALRGLRGAVARTALASAIERCDLGEVRQRLCGALSKGFQQRVGLAQAIVHDPPLLLLDEPTAGLDPVQTARFHALLDALKPDHGIVLSTHQLAEVQRSCDRVAMLHAGRVGFVGSLDEATANGESLEQRFLRLALGVERAA